MYRIEIICRRYKSTLKCSQSPHRQYGATQHRNHKLPIQSFAHQYGRRTDEHMGRCDLVPFLCAKKTKRPHPRTQILSQIPGGGEGNRGQMPHICSWSPTPSPPPKLILIDALRAVCCKDQLRSCNIEKNRFSQTLPELRPR